MLCSTARRLLNTGEGGSCRSVELELLARHLQHCEPCRVYRDRLRAATDQLKADAEQLSAFCVSAHFASGLHDRLTEESKRRDGAPAQWLATRAMVHWRTAGRPLRVGAAACIALVLLLVLALGEPSVLPSTAERPLICQAGHMSSLDIAPANDGRVYAKVTTRTSCTRAATNGGTP